MSTGQEERRKKPPIDPIKGTEPEVVPHSRAHINSGVIVPVLGWARGSEAGASWGQPRTYDTCDLGLLAFACLAAAQQICPKKPKHCSAKFLSVCGALQGLDSPALIAVMS